MQHSLRRSAAGHVADLLHWPQSPPASAKPKVVVLFVPGNPGLPHYYVPFLDAVQGALPPSSAVVYALGHLGHSPAAPRIWSARGVVGLRGQVTDKVRLVDELEEEWGLGKEGGAKLVLIGHSIGSWIICEMLKLRPHLVHSAHLLFPTISHMAASPNGQRMSPLFSPLLSAPLALLTSALALTPAALLTPSVALLAGQSGVQAAVTAGLVRSPGTVVAALGMAGEEMRTVTALDAKCVEEFGARMRWYWAAGEDDGWVADSSVREVEEVLAKAGHLEGRRVRCAEGMVHAFVLTDNHVASLALKCATWIREDCDLDP